MNVSTDAVVAHFKKGINRNEIAKRFGITVSGVNYHLRKYAERPRKAVGKGILYGRHSDRGSRGLGECDRPTTKGKTLPPIPDPVEADIQRRESELGIVTINAEPETLSERIDRLVSLATDLSMDAKNVLAIAEGIARAIHPKD